MPADGDRFPGERVVVTAFVIEHQRGVFLFDTGFSPEPRKMVYLYQPVYMRPIDEALRAAGHGITDVKLIANCHFHADHAGGNRHFTRTPIFVKWRLPLHADPDLRAEARARACPAAERLHPSSSCRGFSRRRARGDPRRRRAVARRPYR